MTPTKQINIQRALTLTGAFNFLYSCAKSCLLPFLTLYFRQLGLTPEMTGIIMGTKHLISLVWCPLASLMANFYNKRRAVVNGSLACSAAVALVLLLFPPIDLHANISLCNASNPRSAPTSMESQPQINSPTVCQPVVTVPANTSQLPQNSTAESKTSSSAVLHTTTLTLGRNKRSEIKLEQEQHIEELEFLGSLKVMDTQHQLFFLVLIAVSVWELVAAPLQWTADDGLYDYLDFADASDHYSGTGVWRLVGAACGVGGAGLLVSQLNCFIFGQTSRSAVHFLCYAGLSVLALPIASFLPIYVNKQQARANRLLKAVQLVRGSQRALLCAVTALLVGMALATVDNFLLWHMQDHNSTELHMGVCLGIACLSQAAFPLLAARLSRLLISDRVLTLATTTLALQFFYYSFLWGAWAVLPAQLFSCLSCGAFWWAVRVQGDNVATPGTERSVKRVYDALIFDLGRAMGSFAGGFVVHSCGLAWLFRAVAMVLMVWCVCLPLLQWNAPRQQRINYSRLLTADTSEASDSESEQERDWLNKAMQDNGRNNNYGRRPNY
ncbi:major facilitator superfamily domain-containing protein 6-like [Dunckerocampus dactyliophorus]|uniref:major facilitator superfamily domain-containing protein 6-like n=1 Tax=Dunckerocampus dactyliophorus TaxID=161453 RepID=UPI0024054E62|nr:major facilitator superfamily domain-containing protein 6-like [Dunckerocampus dactyliophorus]